MKYLINSSLGRSFENIARKKRKEIYSFPAVFQNYDHNFHFAAVAHFFTSDLYII